MRSEGPKLLVLTAALAWAAAPTPALAQADVDPPALTEIEDTTDITITDPTNTWYGVRGLSQTPSAEALGQGRLVLSINAPWYQQDESFAGVPNENADIFTGRASAALGINRFIDGFASVSFYGSNDYNVEDDAGFGTYGGGIQGSLPVPRYAPIRVAAQVAVFDGRSDNQIDSNDMNGYNYFETRTGTDVHTKLMQTLVFGTEDMAFKFHLNEGVVTSLESGRDPLLVTAAALQANFHALAAGLELNSRTNLNDVEMDTDPLWITPSVQFRTGYNVNLSLGSDISLSQEEDGSDVRALEPYRLFGGVALTFDTQEKTRQQVKDEAWRRSQMEKNLRMQNLALASQLQDKDTVTLIDSMENQFLSTGLLVMDAVYFETNKAEISINSEPYLDMLSKMLIKYPKLQIEVAGHTDSTASEAYNQGLSEERAAAVVAYMVNQEQALATRVTSRGYGEARPKADNGTAEGREQNRRTEMEVLNKEALEEYSQPTQQTRGPSEEGQGGTVEPTPTEEGQEGAVEPAPTEEGQGGTVEPKPAEEVEL